MTAKKLCLRWTDDDVRRLRLFADANVTVDTIAKSLGRSRASVKLKAHWLSLFLTQKAPPSPPQRREVAGRPYSVRHGRRQPGHLAHRRPRAATDRAKVRP